jgi:Flp pilus assembly protein TadD
LWSNLAGALRQQERFQEAEKILLDQALRLVPDLPAAHLNLGMVYLQADRPDLASEHLQLAARLLPPAQSAEAQTLLEQTQDPTRWLRLGGLLLENGEPAGAAQAFDTASRLGAPIAEAAYGLSSALIQLEDWGNARSVLESALGQAPEDASLYNNLGVVYQALGEFDLARQMFEKAIQLAPEWEEPQRNLQELIGNN